MTRPFPTISHEWDEAELKKAPQRVHGDAKSTQSQDKTLRAQAFITSHILYLRKSGGGAQRAIAFVEGREYASSKVQWQVTLPHVPETEVHKEGELAAIIKKAVKEAFLVRCVPTS